MFRFIVRLVFGKAVKRQPVASERMTLEEAMDKSLVNGFHSVEWGQFGRW